jgi:hypothetical protein
VARTDTDERVTKRRVTCRSASIVPGMTGPKGEPVTQTWEKVDYVRPDFLDAYVAAARDIWQSVEVSDEPDAGPAGYDGATYVPATHPVRLPDGTRQERPFPHELAGTYFPATGDKKFKDAPAAARVVVDGAVVRDPQEG